MPYIGSFNIDDTVVFYGNTHDGDDAADADSTPTFRVYEMTTGTALGVSGNMALLDDANTTGHYSGSFTASAANGFELGKQYEIRKSATVGGVTGIEIDTFQVGAKVDAIAFSGGSTAADNAELAFDGTGYDIGGIDVSVLNTAATAVGSDGSGLTEAGGTGDHLTAIDLPDQSMNITGNITGNLSGSVGSVTGGINTGAGTITTLDGLDTAQDVQHGTTQTAITNLNDPTASAIADAVLDEALSGHATAGTLGKAISDILVQWTTALTEAYSTAGGTITPAQFVYEMTAYLNNFSISGTTRTSKQRDNSTTAMTHTLNDATNPTALERTT